ncbi:uncharacterized protein EDB93DRAFT_1182757, partial [Suillus bovinus]|uniref:uncharacterized protein n=1 Tax=Suillus bovinus TaxID=48563 RepID=UPI001B861511
MSPHLTEQLREWIIVWHSKTIAEIAQLAGCSQRNFGQTRDPFAHCRGKPRTLNQQDLSFITSILNANSSLPYFLDEISRAAAEMFQVSIPTLSHSLHRLAVTHKRTSNFQRQQQSEMSCC